MKILVLISVILSLGVLFLAYGYFSARNNCGGCVRGCQGREVCDGQKTSCNFYEYSRRTIKKYLNSCNVNQLDKYLK